MPRNDNRRERLIRAAAILRELIPFDREIPLVDVYYPIALTSHFNYKRLCCRIPAVAASVQTPSRLAPEGCLKNEKKCSN